MLPDEITRERRLTATFLALCLVCVALGWTARGSEPAWDVSTELARAYGEIEQKEPNQ